MDGVHDLGGEPGFGEVDRLGEDEVFHERWEASVFAMVNSAAIAGAYQNSDQFRHAIERINPEAYLTHGYYGRWLGGLETLLVEAGIVTQAEIDERAVSLGASADDLVAAQPSTDPDQQLPRNPSPDAYRQIDAAPLFQVGDQVFTEAQSKPGHTRLPAYARRKPGVIISHHGGWVYPDTNAHGQGEQPQHLYTVSFRSEDLWGTPGFTVTLDLFEPYLLAPTAGEPS